MESFTNYDEVIKEIPEKVQQHLDGLLKDTKAPKEKKTKIRLVEAWLLKRALFDKMVEHENFRKATSMPKDSPNGCIAMTLSGSIVSIGPLVNNTREIKYTSIGMRTDVPESLHVKNGKLAEDIHSDNPILFIDGPLEKTSAIVDLALSSPEHGEAEQTSSLQKAIKTLLDSFIKVNKEALEPEAKTDIFRNRNDLFSKWIIIQWFLIGGIKKHIFMARAKLLWLELFTPVYEALTKKKKTGKELEGMFLDFTNTKFGKFIDDYKWYESEKKDFDIGLMKALEELTDYPSYIEFRKKFIGSL